MPLTPDPQLRVFLSETLARRRERNRAYSLRAFARHLQLSPSFLSEILSGKKALSEPKVERIRALLEREVGSGNNARPVEQITPEQVSTEVQDE